MLPLKNSSKSGSWTTIVARAPLPVRAVLVMWIILSIVFYVGSPEATANLPPFVALLALLPMSVIGLGVAFFLLWRGFGTIAYAVKSIAAKDKADPAPYPNTFGSSVGGWGALNIYLAVYSLAVMWLAHWTGNYAASVSLSSALCLLLAYGLFWRKPHRSDVKILLVGSLIATVLFGTVMATVAVPPA